MSDNKFSEEEFRELLAITRRVVPYWLRQHHHTLSLAGHAAEELLSMTRFATVFLRPWRILKRM